LPILPATLVLRNDAVTRLDLRLRGTSLLEEFLLLAVTARTLLLRLLAVLLRRGSLHLRRRLLNRLILLQLSLLWLSARLVRLVFAATPAAPMSL
jgi:hypothetical protein